jgi:hypothetical protein
MNGRAVAPAGHYAHRGVCDIEEAVAGEPGSSSADMGYPSRLVLNEMRLPHWQDIVQPQQYGGNHNDSHYRF